MTSSNRPKVLRKLRIGEVSWVDKPANPGAELMVFKRDDGTVAKGPGADAFDAAMAGQEAQETIQAAWQAFYETMDALRQAACSIVENPDVAPADKAAALKDAMQRAVEQIPDAIAEGAAKAGTEKRHRIPAGAAGEVGKGGGSRPPLSIPAARDGVAKGSSAVSTENAGGAAGNAAHVDVAALQKQLDAQATTMAELTKKAAEADELKKRVEDAEAIAKAEREMRVEAEFTKRAETELPNLAGEPITKGRMLRGIVERTRSADEGVKKQAEAELATLKAADAAAGSLFKAVGKSGQPTSGDDPRAELGQRVEKAMRDDPKLTKAQANRQVMASDPAFAKRYDEEVRANGH